MSCFCLFFNEIVLIYIRLPVKAFFNLLKLPLRHKGDWFILFPFRVNSIASGFRHVEIGAVDKAVTVVHYKPSAQKKDQFQEIFMEYERKNLCCDDGFLIIFCHDRYYKVHFCFYQIIINIRVIVCSSNHLSDARYNITVSGYISSRCRSGTPNTQYRDYDSQITLKKLLRTSLGHFT